MSPVPGNPSGWVTFKGVFVSFISSLGDCQIRHLPTKVLLQLKTDFHNEIERRKRNEVVESVRAARKKYSKTTIVDRGMLEVANSAALLKIPVEGNAHVRLTYLRALINQNWSHLFQSDCESENKYYVYAHVDPEASPFCSIPEFGGHWGGMPFYIGKGCGQRAYDLKRNQMHGKLIAKALKAGFEPSDIVHIISSGLTESKALEIEAKYIYFFGATYQSKTGCLVNLDQSMVPEFSGVMTRYEKLKKENKHWMSQWTKDNAEILRGKDGTH